MKKCSHTFGGQQGISLIEVIVTTGIVAIVMTALLSAISVGLANAVVSKSKLQATKLTQEGIEYFRTQRNLNGWENFLTSVDETSGTATATYCMAVLPASSNGLTQLPKRPCAANEFVDEKQVFQRYAEVTRTIVDGNEVVNVQVNVTHKRGDKTLTSSAFLEMNNTNYFAFDPPRPVALYVPLPSPDPSPIPTPIPTPSPSPIPSPTPLPSPVINGFYAYHLATNQRAEQLGNGSSVYLYEYPSGFGIEVVTTPSSVGTVSFDEPNWQTSTDNTPPYVFNHEWGSWMNIGAGDYIRAFFGIPEVSQEITDINFFNHNRSSAQGNDIQPNEVLNRGQSIASSNGSYSFTYNQNGNLFLSRNSDGQSLWTTNTSSGPGSFVILQGDGNLVMYRPNGTQSYGTAIWSSGTSGSSNTNSYANLLNNGNLVIYRPDGTPIWATNTVQPTAQGNDIQPNEVLNRSQSIYSNNGLYRLVYQGDGNLVIYRTQNGSVLWASGTSAVAGSYLVMQGDGNLVMYRHNGAAFWSTGTSGNPGNYLVMQDNGNLVMFRSNGTVIWSTNTAQP